MRLSTILRIALRSLNRSKMRSFLTMLGIIIGVASVITMLAVGQGAKDMVHAQIASLGTNILMVMPGAFSQSGVRLEAGTASRLTEEDVVSIRKTCPSITNVTPTIRSGAQIKFSGQNWRTSVYGIYPEYLDIRDWPLKDGAVFSDADNRSGAKVCVIGQTVADNLFTDGSEPIGQIIRIKNLPFKVVGVLGSKGQNAMGQDQDDIILAPFSTIQKKLMGETYVGAIMASAISDGKIELARQEMDDALRLRRSGGGDGVSYTIRTQSDISNTAGQTSRTLSMLLASIAFVSLIVGGIGIMNIMLVSVTERTREIGIRLAVGAREQDILLQFLVEALVLSLAGGILGILLGTGVSIIISKMQGWPITISTLSIVLGFSFSAAIGVFFGWYPARKAAIMNPIEALRYE